MIKIQPTTVISSSSYIGYYRNFLSSDECDFITKNQNFGSLRTKVNAGGQYEQDENFTLSHGRLLTIDEINNINLVQKLKDTFDLSSVTQAEPFLLARYPENGFLRLHHDRRPNSPIMRRMATLILYFNDDYEGGELHFPRLNLQIRPKKGSGVFFTYGNNPDADANLIHESKINTGNAKYMLPVFMRVPEFIDEYKEDWKKRHNLESIDF